MSAGGQKQVIIFDIGMVLVDVRFDSLFHFLRARGLVQADSAALARALDYEQYETGKISDEEFYRRVLKLTSKPFSYADWCAAWTGVLVPCERMLGLADSLARRYPVYILTNTNSLHYEHMERQLNLRRRYRGVVTSFEAGAMKPDAAIYAYAKREFDLGQTSAVFLDDREENVRAGQDAGWEAHRFVNYESAIALFRRLGIETD